MPHYLGLEGWHPTLGQGSDSASTLPLFLGHKNGRKRVAISPRPEWSRCRRWRRTANRNNQFYLRGSWYDYFIGKVADDHELVRTGLATLLKGSDIEIVSAAANGDDAVNETLKHSPDVVLMDIRMVESDGLTALERIRKESPQTPVIMLSTYDNPTYVARSVALGACDYVLKGSSRQELISAIECAARGQTPDPDSILQRVKKRPWKDVTSLPRKTFR